MPSADFASLPARVCPFSIGGNIAFCYEGIVLIDGKDKPPVLGDNVSHCRAWSWVIDPHTGKYIEGCRRLFPLMRISGRITGSKIEIVLGDENR